MSSRFATVQETLSPSFRKIWGEIASIHKQYNLPDHTDVNLQRYPWSDKLITSPAPYAARLWEYPFSLIEADLSVGLQCADIGCGMSAFTIYLADLLGIDSVIGIDADVFESGVKYKGHGVSREFLNRTGIDFLKSDMTSLHVDSNTFDRVFCISVIEHLPRIKVPQAMREMSRVLKPGGRLVLTMDVNIFSDITNPPSLIWDTGLVPCGDLNLHWPVKRFGIFNNGREPADVYGMILYKPLHYVDAYYSNQEVEDLVFQSDIPYLRRRAWKEKSLHRKVGNTLKKYFFGR